MDGRVVVVVLDSVTKLTDTTRTVFTPHEREQVHLKAMEQAMRAAELAKVDSELLVPLERRRVARTWQSTWTTPQEIIGEHCMSYLRGLTPDDFSFLKVNKISPA